ncbi:MAG: LPXTG cell wall anchor domain-containing protein [Bacteroidota bacterium]
MNQQRLPFIYLLLLFLLGGNGEILGQMTDSLYLANAEQAVIQLDPARDTTIRIKVNRHVLASTCGPIAVKPKLNLVGGDVKLGFNDPESITSYLGWSCARKERSLLVDISFKGLHPEKSQNGSLTLSKGGSGETSFADLVISFQVKGATSPPPKPSGDLKLVKNDDQLSNTYAAVLKGEQSKILSLKHVAEPDVEPLSLSYTLSPPDKASKLIRLSTAKGPLNESFQLKGGEILDITIEKLKEETAQFSLVINDEKKVGNKVDVTIQLQGKKVEGGETAISYVWYILLGLLVAVGLGWYFLRKRKTTDEQIQIEEVSSSSASSQADFAHASTNNPQYPIKAEDQLIVNKAFLEAFVKKARRANTSTNALLNSVSSQLINKANQRTKPKKGNAPKTIQDLTQQYQDKSLIQAAIGIAKGYFQDVPKKDILDLSDMLQNRLPNELYQQLLNQKSGLTISLKSPVVSTRFLQNLYQLGGSEANSGTSGSSKKSGIVIKPKADPQKLDQPQLPPQPQSTPVPPVETPPPVVPLVNQEAQQTLSQLSQRLQEAKLLSQNQSLLETVQDLISIANEWSQKRIEHEQLLKAKISWDKEKERNASDLQSRSKTIQTHLKTIGGKDKEIERLKTEKKLSEDKFRQLEEFLKIFRTEHPMTWDRIQGLKSETNLSVTNPELRNYAFDLVNFLNDSLEDEKIKELEEKFTTLAPFKKTIDESTRERINFIREIADSGQTNDKGLTAYLIEEEKPEEGLRNYVEDRLYESLNDQLIYLEELSHLNKFPIEIDEGAIVEIQNRSKSRSKQLRTKLKELTGIEVAEVELFQEFSKELENQCKWGTDQDKLDEKYKQLSLPRQKVKEIKKFGYKRGDTTEMSDVIIS